MTRLDWLLASLTLLALIGALVWIVWLVTASFSVWPSVPTATEAAVAALIEVSPQGLHKKKPRLTGAKRGEGLKLFRLWLRRHPLSERE